LTFDTGVQKPMIIENRKIIGRGRYARLSHLHRRICIICEYPLLTLRSHQRRYRKDFDRMLPRCQSAVQIPDNPIVMTTAGSQISDISSPPMISA
jgi:RNase P subunit RPR2